MKQIYTSLDIGTDTIKVVACELYQNKLNLLAASSAKSEGVKKGLIVNPEKAAASIKKAIYEVETQLGIKVKKIIASVPSYFSDFVMIEGSTEIPLDEFGNPGVISGNDVIKVLQIAMKPKLTSAKEMVTVMPIEFLIDHKESIMDPKGIRGSVLEVRAVMASVPVKNVYSVVSLLESIGIETIDVSISGIGDFYTFKEKFMDDKLGVLVNIGAETTTVSLYNKGIIVKNSVIQVGGKNIDNDLMYMYKLAENEAIKLKEKFALAHKMHANVGDMYECINSLGDTIKLNQYEVSEVVEARLEEILNLAKQEIEVLTNRELDYIIFTGGTSNIANLKQILDEMFKTCVIIGNVKIIGLRNNKYSAAIGNMIYFIKKLELKGKTYSMLSRGEEEELSSVKKNIVNGSESMLGKVFGYFFNE